MSLKAAIRHSGSSRSKWLCRKTSKGGALFPTCRLLLPREDETVEFRSDQNSAVSRDGLEKAVAVTRTPHAEPISLAEVLKWVKSLNDAAHEQRELDEIDLN